MTSSQKSLLALALTGLGLGLSQPGDATPAAAAPAATPAAATSATTPDTAIWAELLSRYYDPAKGMNYRALKAKDAAALETQKQKLGQVDAAKLGKKDQLAYWINVYNVNVVATVVEGYPVASIRDLSTDILVRLNVFKKERVPVHGGAKISLNDVENAKIREVFKDPRIHFAINCAAKSCPPIRSEPYTGARLDEQLDDQVRKFLTGPFGVRLDKDGDRLTVHTTKIMDWFSKDFDAWAGGGLAFLKKHLPADKAQPLTAAGDKAKLAFDDYDWKLNESK